MIYGIDLLSLTIYNESLTLEKLKTNPHYNFLEINNVNTMYLHTFEIYKHDLQLVGVLFFSSKTNKTHHLKMTNRQFYSIGFSTLLVDVLASIQVTEYKIQNIHIYVDSNINFVSRFDLKAAKTYESGFENVKHREQVEYYGKYFNRLFQPDSYRLDETIYIGKKDNAKSLCLYHKTNSIKNDNKDYILDFYRQNFSNKINLTKTIHRAELRLHNTVFECDNVKYRINNTDLLHTSIDLENPYKKQHKYRYEISKQTYGKLDKEIQKNYTAFNHKKIYGIDISRLEDQHYIASIFYQFSFFVKSLKEKFFNLKQSKIKIENINFMYTDKNILNESKPLKKFKAIQNATDKKIELLTMIYSKTGQLLESIKAGDTEIINSDTYLFGLKIS